MRGYKYNFTNRKFYVFVLTIMVCLIGSLSIAYAILSTSLNITGSTDIVASNWDIYISSYLEVDSGSVTDELPVVNETQNHLDFSAKLEEPGDYYRFVFRVKNKGTIDAMIDSIVKTPELTEEQAKYLSYNIEYEDGTPINEKHFLAREDGNVKIAVTVAFRTDIEISDLPKEDIELNLGLTMVYVQADNSSFVPEANVERRITVYFCSYRPYYRWSNCQFCHAWRCNNSGTRCCDWICRREGYSKNTGTEIAGRISTGGIFTKTRIC